MFLGRHLVESALERGHEVSIFTRGQSNAELFPEVEKLRGDRDGNLEALRGRRWDVCVDTSGFVPRVVGDSAGLLADNVERYVFISTVSVYADFSRPVVEEHAPLATIPDETSEDRDEHYGPLKALSERAAEDAMPGRALVIRPGLIVGPHDTSVRFIYWTRRVERGGEVLAPGSPSRQVQFIDARDLAAWTIRMAEQRQTGTFNASGPDYKLTMGRFLEECREVTRSGARFKWVGDQFLLERGVEPWSEIPLWLPEDAETPNHFLSINVERAVKAGLTFRPLAETIRDTIAWDASREDKIPVDKDGVPLPDETLGRERERELLDEWHRRIEEG
jgi:2'-hydroxyisoflavone reductase